MISYLTQDDTLPVIFEGFKDADGYDIPTNTVSAVAFSLKNRSTGTLKVSAAVCSILSSGTDGLRCQWSPGATDLDTPADYDGELRISYISGKIKRYPERAGEFIFTVRSKLA